MAYVPATPVGVVRLATYWVGRPRTAPGATESIGYLIANPTGQTLRLLLGASIKPAGRSTWLADAISDPPDDAVATVPPGTTLHLRFFALPTTLHRGAYDVAWGLSDPVTGRRVVLVMAPRALQVTG